MAILLVPLTDAATCRVLWALVCLLFCPCYFFHGSLSYSVYKQWCFCYYYYYFFAARSFSSVDNLALEGGAARQIVSSIFFFYSLRFFLWFLHFIKCVGRACRIQYDDTALHFALLSLLHTWYVAT